MRSSRPIARSAASRCRSKRVDGMTRRAARARGRLAARALPGRAGATSSKRCSSIRPAGWRAATAFDLDIAAGQGARLVVTTAAAEKVYRTLGPDADDRREARLSRPGATLAWLPQETILFDRARLSRSDRGRSRGRRAAAPGRGHRVRPLRHGRGGRTRARCSTAGACGATAGWSMPKRCGSTARLRPRLAQPAVANGGVAVATVLIVPGDEAAVDRRARAAGPIHRRGRRLGLERHRGRAAVRRRRRGVAARPRPVADGAARRRCRASGQLTESERDEPDSARKGQAADRDGRMVARRGSNAASSSTIRKRSR